MQGFSIPFFTLYSRMLYLHMCIFLGWNEHLEVSLGVSWNQLLCEVACVHSWIKMCISDPRRLAQVWIKIFFSFCPSSLPHFLEVLFLHKSLASRRYYCSRALDQLLVGEESLKWLANHNAYYKFGWILYAYWLKCLLLHPPSYFLHELAFVCQCCDLHPELAHQNLYIYF